jgi:transcriptional regulator with XRE-family HTH domain
MTKWKTKWHRGDKAKLAELVGISRSSLSNILSGRSPVSFKRAIGLAYACKQLGYRISVYEWGFPDQRRSPLFKH